tara:strand:+ start:148 stop:516 length:369 start_codon:yes stop_codon:yes gene_type:complete
MSKLRLTETQLIELIENTINEPTLLTEKKVCGRFMKKSGQNCENRRRQQAFNCGVKGGWKSVSPGDTWGCGGMISNGGDCDTITCLDGQICRNGICQDDMGRIAGLTDDLMENLIKRTLRRL